MARADFPGSRPDAATAPCSARATWRRTSARSHTADVGVAPHVRRRVDAAAEGRVELPHAFLPSLLLQVQVDGSLGCAVSVRALDECAVGAEVDGEPLDRRRHRLHDEVKAVTWHQLAVDPRARGFRPHVILGV